MRLKTGWRSSESRFTAYVEAFSSALGHAAYSSRTTTKARISSGDSSMFCSSNLSRLDDFPCENITLSIFHGFTQRTSLATMYHDHGQIKMLIDPTSSRASACSGIWCALLSLIHPHGGSPSRLHQPSCSVVQAPHPENFALSRDGRRVSRCDRDAAKRPAGRSKRVALHANERV